MQKETSASYFKPLNKIRTRIINEHIQHINEGITSFRTQIQVFTTVCKAVQYLVHCYYPIEQVSEGTFHLFYLFDFKPGSTVVILIKCQA